MQVRVVLGDEYTTKNTISSATGFDILPSVGERLQVGQHRYLVRYRIFHIGGMHNAGLPFVCLHVEKDDG
jgi:hypothetical protein